MLSVWCYLVLQVVGEGAGCYTDDEGKEPSQVLSVEVSSGCVLQELLMTKEASSSRPLQERLMTKEVVLSVGAPTPAGTSMLAM